MNMPAQEEQKVVKSGRGGNNIAENMKKSFFSIIRKKLCSRMNAELQQRLVKPFNLKSQKENIMLLFLFLHVFVREGKITLKDIEDIRTEFIFKIDKYISNSEVRMIEEESRREFHMKNI